ncbi:ImmA/IrrE family metallo-endopeptidase [Noviherbaspirillum sedimenti]|uniref:ImmA/IrrE family metallo-endopeptidase n=1 Tax=Noviherbaspirillum sedimenti TaxID=2320865 RepID=A0A3A3GJK9_9BURK|nr:ImmA/IrrE family metallo-endopeptidase [Noviherbaspirillum sedimenti]RJG01140.1 ImmA/IrrE family metallo-endopeptidase [Noviherbaspirillum sedimenti]
MNHASIHLDAKKSAYQILDSVWRGRGFPVDPTAIATQMGIAVLEAELPENILGGLIKDAGKAPVVMLNQCDSADRKRFNCAQKLGYYAGQMNRHAECYKYVEFRLRQGGIDDGALEVFADAFAASLLMPDLAVRQLARKGLAFSGMASHFGVTADALEYRLKQLGIDLEQIVAA